MLKSAYYYQLLPWFAHFPSRVYVDVLEQFDDAAVQRMVAWLGLPYLGENGYKDQEAVVALAGAKRNVARDGGVLALSEEACCGARFFFSTDEPQARFVTGAADGLSRLAACRACVCSREMAATASAMAMEPRR